MAAPKLTIATDKLVDCLEGGLRQAGLRSVLPKHRQDADYGPVGGLALAVMTYGGAGFLITQRHGLTSAVLFLITASVLIVLGVGVWIVIRSVLIKSRTTNSEYVGNLLLISFPVGLCALTLVWYLSLSLALLIALIQFASVVLIFFLHRQFHRIMTWVSRARLLFQMTIRSVTVLPVLMPMLVLLVLFSLFSSELWQVLSGVSATRVPYLILLLALPSITISVVMIRHEAASLVNESNWEKIGRTDLVSVPAVSPLYQLGRLSDEEIDMGLQELQWRNNEITKRELFSPMMARVRLLLFAWVVATTLVLWILFALYLFVFFEVTVDPSLIQQWLADASLGQRTRPTSMLAFPGLNASQSLNAHVSALLSAVISFMATVYLWTDEAVRANYHRWLRPKVAAWVTSARVYRALIAPGFQILKYKVNTPRKGIVNVEILVPTHFSQSDIEAACQRVRSWYEKIRLVIVQAYKIKEGEQRYGREYADESWEMCSNLGNDVYDFSYKPQPEGTLRREHWLGHDYLKEGVRIPADWFGTRRDLAKIGESIWQADEEHMIILHPYVSETSELTVVSVRLLKRLGKSEHYRQLIKQLLAICLGHLTSPKTNLHIDVFFRDQYDGLCSMEWNPESPFVTYKDEFTKRSYEKPSRWIKAA